MIQTAWVIIFFFTAAAPILMLLGSIIDGEIDIKQAGVALKIDFVCAFSLIYGQIFWSTVITMFFTIAGISVSVLCVIKKRLDRHVEDLVVAVAKLDGMETTLGRLKQIPFAKQCHIWLKNVGDLHRTAQYIKVGYDRCGSNYSKRLHLGRRACQLLNVTNDLLRQGDNLLHPQDQLRGTTNFYKKKVTNFIHDMDDDTRLLWIWGMGGVGKTSLLKLLVGDCLSEYDSDSFEVLFVRAGIGCTVGQVQEAIATSRGLSLECNETSQAKTIHDHLKDTSFLLLLDDLWGYLDLKAVGIPSPLGTVGVLRPKQRKVVLTSRNMDLCWKMGCSRDNTVQMKCLDELDVWNLFSRGWPVRGFHMDKLPEVLPAAPSSSSRTRRQLVVWKGCTVGVSYVQEAWLSEMKSSCYKKMCYFIEKRDAKSLLLGIWGMRGVGKTTLLRLARDSYRYEACFDHIMFIGAGTGHRVKNVQHAIAINLGLDLAMMSSLDELSRADLIFNHLEHKSFLLLLDGIREPLNWWAIGLPLFLHRQQKIILATRSEAACFLMGCHVENTIEMHRLGEADAWKLFTDKAGQGDNPQVHHFAQEMVAKCGGLPLALSALGRAMSNKRDLREWRCAYNQLKDIKLEPCEIDDKMCSTIFHNPLWNKTPFGPMFSSIIHDSPQLAGSALPSDETLPQENVRGLIRHFCHAAQHFFFVLPEVIKLSSGRGGRLRLRHGLQAIWKNRATPKSKLFVWLALQHRIWTSDRRARHGLQATTDACFVCLQEEDNAEHILVQCVYAREVWFRVGRELQTDLTPSSSDTLQEWWMQRRQRVPPDRRKWMDALVCVGCHAIWKNRNAWCFNNPRRQHDASTLARMIVGEFRLLQDRARAREGGLTDVARE